MSNLFLIADTHFFHHKILEFEAAARPFSNVEEMNEAIVDRWNSTITKRDTVWHLGDVCFGHVENLNILRRLNGTKHLIPGNHDGYGIRHYLDHFNKIEACRKFDGYLWSHIPIHPAQFYRFKGNVHGHLHSERILSGEKFYHRSAQTGRVVRVDDIPDTRYINVSCEQNNLTPIAWEELKKRNTHD